MVTVVVAGTQGALAHVIGSRPIISFHQTSTSCKQAPRFRQFLATSILFVLFSSFSLFTFCFQKPLLFRHNRPQAVFSLFYHVTLPPDTPSAHYERYHFQYFLLPNFVVGPAMDISPGVKCSRKFTCFSGSGFE
ncbi:hypothetical protein IW261DRAFT_1431581 [Armillaria novae-zelandiae]|uniref:Uncharacterized protein n=1 Tax=Armillaria novae-zelandiae TaxID=153914 RepID=A0AA39TIE2_9AGAR|nr:hypothetical protein IW261DRAFT_1431581 [Armillaria novae-zelandiae]